MSVYPAHGWLPAGAEFSWQHPDQGRDFVTNWQGVIQAPGDGVCVGVWADAPFPNGFGPHYPIVKITTGPFSKGGSPGQPADFQGLWYIGHCSSLVKPGQTFRFGTPLARADQGHNFAGTNGGWVELGMDINGRLGPSSTTGHWFDALLQTPLVKGTTVKAGDHSNGGAIIGGSLKGQGFHGLVRYAAQNRPDVSISAREAADLKANGIPVAIVCEHEANWLLRAGVAPRMLASQHISTAAGLPEGIVFGAADFDSTNGGPTFPGSAGDRQMHTIAANLAAAGKEIGGHNVGFYGSYFAVDWLVKNAPGLCSVYWQTAAWSRGLVHPHAAIYQHAASVKVAGVDVDLDEIFAPNWGQRGAQAVVAKAGGPKGEFVIELQSNFRTGEHRVKGLPNPGVELGGPNRWASAKISVNSETGQWKPVEPMQWNAPPLGG